MAPTVDLTGADLDLEVLALVAGGATLRAHPDAVAEAARAHRDAALVAERREVYGHTTGVGAARAQLTGSDVEHGVRLLRSHAAGWGEPLPEPLVRAALAIRANQLLAGGSGASPELAVALADLAGGPADDLPVVHRHGSLGTADLTALAEVGLTLLGERTRAGGRRHRVLDLAATDALPLLSSNAFALAEAALATRSVARTARAASTVCGLTFVAVRGNPEAFSDAAARATPFPGAAEVAGHVRGLVGDQGVTPAHIQDFFGLRTWPQVHGPLLDWSANLRTVVETLVNTASENPVFTPGPDGPEVAHHGGFHAAYLALGADSTLLALARSAAAVQSRVAHLLTGREGLPLFLADETSGSSGLLIAEYVAASAVAVVRQAAATPSAVQTAQVSAGIEDDASFAAAAAERLTRAAEAYRRLLAVELVCAVRALRQSGVTPVGRLGAALARCDQLPVDLADRDVAQDFAVAEQVLDGYAAEPV
ncbi:aromatic amino acid ammonia-lyase [Phycicoccus ginsengisoli]